MAHPSKWGAKRQPRRSPAETYVTHPAVAGALASILLDEGARRVRFVESANFSEPLEEVLRQLAKMQYERTHLDLAPGSFRLRGDSLEIYPPYDDTAVRISFWGDQVESIERIDPVRGQVVDSLDRLPIYPRTHYVTPRENLIRAIDGIRARGLLRPLALHALLLILPVHRPAPPDEFNPIELELTAFLPEAETMPEPVVEPVAPATPPPGTMPSSTAARVA